MLIIIKKPMDNDKNKTKEQLIAELEQAREELAEYRNYYTDFVVFQMLTEKAGFVFYELDYASQKYTYISDNMEKLLGVDRNTFTQKDLINRIVELKLTDEKLPSTHATLVSAFKNKIVDYYQLDFSFKKDDGNVIWLSDFSIPMKNEETGDVTKSLGILIDITWRKKIEEALKKRTDELEMVNCVLDKAKNALWGEMQLARKIQKSLLPKDPELRGFDIACFSRPASEVGGDYYDIIHCDSYYWVIIGDVSGHGVASGLVMMMAQTAINNLLEYNPALSPSKLLEIVNRTVYKNLCKFLEEKYMSITAFRLDRDNRLTFAGLHQDILIYRSADKHIETISTDGMWIGILDDLSSILTDNSFMIEKDDIILLYTDGITEAKKKQPVRKDRRKNYFGEERLKQILVENCTKSSEEIKKSVIDTLKQYNSNDDQTLVVLKKL